MNMITIALILIVIVAVAGIGAALIWFTRSQQQSSDAQIEKATQFSDREQHIESLLKEFEEQLGQAGDQDERKN